MRAPFYILFFLFPQLLFTQVQDPIWFHQIEVKDGLPSNRVMEVFMDSQGFVWTASLDGLARFDGFQVKKYLSVPGDSTALQEDMITGKLLEDKRSNIWLCTEKALYCYHRKQDCFSNYLLKSEQGIEETGKYFAIALEKDTFLWLRGGLDKSLYYFNIHTHEFVRTSDKIKFDINIFPGFNRAGRLQYLFSVNGTKGYGLELIELNEKREVVQHDFFFNDSLAPLSRLYVSTVHFDGKNTVWMGTKGKVVRWDFHTKKAVFFPTGRDKLIKIASIDSALFWVCESEVGLHTFDPEKGTYTLQPGRIISRPDAEVNSSFRRPYLGNDGTIWVSLEDHALLFAQINRRKFQSIPKEWIPVGATNYSYGPMVQDKNQNIWVGTYTDGLLQYDASGKIIRQFHPKLKGNAFIQDKQFNHLILDNAENLWIATTGGVLFRKAEGGAFIKVSAPETQGLKDVTYLLALSGNRILAGTFQHGIYLIEKKDDEWHIKRILASEINRGFSTTSLHQDKYGLIYANHNFEKINIYKKINDSLYFQKSLRINRTVRGFYEDQDRDFLWMATSNGLVRLQTNDLNQAPVIFTNSNSLNIQSLQGDSLGNFWLGTTEGIQCFYTEKGTFRKYSMAEGIQSLQFHLLASMKHQDGSLWFGGNFGITIVKPWQIKPESHTFPIYLSELKINDKRPDAQWKSIVDTANVSLKKRYEFEYEERTLTFHFAAMDYGDPKLTQMEFYMEGQDNDWVSFNQTGPGLARYPNLKPDKYTFFVRAISNDEKGVKPPPGLQLQIRIKPPYWQTTWFILSMIALFGLIIWGLIRYRINLIREKAEFRTRIAENKLTALRAQMNPHFLFNSLNSINNYILGNKPEYASQYLSRFAGLIRKIFDLSQHANISLEEELEMLKLYLQVESMRFRNPFTYSISLDDEIDPYEIQIPTMILQPFVENAIKHGIAHKESGKGEIQINISLDASNLVCSIQDNGVGRKKSAEINLQKGRKHNSRGIDITRERLAILQNQTKNHYQIKMEDLKNEEGQAFGTRVEIVFPHAL